MRNRNIAAIAVIGAIAGAHVISDAAAESGTTTRQSAAASQDVNALNKALKDEIRTENGVRYACTGVGKESRDDPRWDKFSTKLVYSLQGGGYLVDVRTRITDAQGQDVVFEQRCDGPWLLVGLDPGTYQVTATSEDKSGEIHKRQIQISVDESGQTARIINFPEIRG